jgi:hypothetical protein
MRTNVNVYTYRREWFSKPVRGERCKFLPVQQIHDLFPPAAAGNDPGSLRSIIAELIVDAEVAQPGTPALESRSGMDDTVQLLGCRILEGSSLGALPVGEPCPRFRAFLDGRQRSEPIAFVRGVPLVLGNVAAVIRCRGAAAPTWRMLRESRLYVSMTQLGRPLPTSLLAKIEVVDTDSQQAPANGASSARHPMELMRRTMHLIQRARENLERALALQWCTDNRGEPLLVDGSISRMGLPGDAESIIGLVKNHRTMYLQEDELACVFSLRVGERSSSFLVESRNSPVASWYLRLRREKGVDPLWGLVRIEVPVAGHSPERADELSRWILAETVPVSLPDARWDRLIYGVRDCEIFLSAVM